MNRAYPKNILMLPYESLMDDPLKSFTKILKFFDLPKAIKSSNSKLKRTIKLSSRKNLKKVEKITETPLANDQLPGKATHIRSGASGVWKKYLDEKDLKLIDQRLNQFGLNSKQFQLT